MRYTIIIIYLSLIFISCQKPAIQLKPGYDFSYIKTMVMEEIKDYPYSPESGMSVANALSYHLKKLGLKIIDEQNIDTQSYDALLMCSILEFKEKRAVFIPVEIIDQGNSAAYSESAYAQADASLKTSSSYQKSTFYQSPITRVKEIQFTDAVVGLTLQLVAASDKSILWSSNYSYTALNQTDALNKCVAGAISPLQKILKR